MGVAQGWGEGQGRWFGKFLDNQKRQQRCFALFCFLLDTIPPSA